MSDVDSRIKVSLTLGSASPYSSPLFKQDSRLDAVNIYATAGDEVIVKFPNDQSIILSTDSNALNPLPPDRPASLRYQVMGDPFPSKTDLIQGVLGKHTRFTLGVTRITAGDMKIAATLEALEQGLPVAAYRLLQGLSGNVHPDSLRNSRGQTALMIAAEAGDGWVIEGLLGMGADPNATAYDGSTALMYAAMQKGLERKDCIKVLLRNSNTRSHDQRADGLTAANLARLPEGQGEYVAAMLDHHTAFSIREINQVSGGDEFPMARAYEDWLHSSW